MTKPANNIEILKFSIIMLYFDSQECSKFITDTFNCIHKTFSPRFYCSIANLLGNRMRPSKINNTTCDFRSCWNCPRRVARRRGHFQQLLKTQVILFPKVHLTPKFFFGRDETVQLSHKEFDNFISIWPGVQYPYFLGTFPGNCLFHRAPC